MLLILHPAASTEPACTILYCVRHTAEPHQEERPAARGNRDSLKVRSPTRILGQWRSWLHRPIRPIRSRSLTSRIHLHLHVIRVSSGLIISRFLSHPHWSVFAYPHPLPDSDPSFVCKYHHLRSSSVNRSLCVLLFLLSTFFHNHLQLCLIMFLTRWPARAALARLPSQSQAVGSSEFERNEVTLRDQRFNSRSHCIVLQCISIISRTD
jgi:hypothetical protein